MISSMDGRGELFTGNLMTCVGDYEIKPHAYITFIKKNKCICTDNMLENELMYLYLAFLCFNVRIAYNTYIQTNINHEIN